MSCRRFLADLMARWLGLVLLEGHLRPFITRLMVMNMGRIVTVAVVMDTIGMMTTMGTDG
jgi:hypothetical protein